MKGILERLTRNLVRRGIRDGLLGGNGIWLALGATAWLVRWLGKKPAPRVVTEQLRLGESLTVTSVPPPPFGRKARKLDKADRKAAKLAWAQIRAERKRAPAREPASAASRSSSGRQKGGSNGKGKTRKRAARSEA
ncbi:MAG TPA: hypothetical protein VKA05_08095 [Acidimicrobiales bacterium]|nr:hypothetical protein [Acidimicrobiales bacterium]